MARSFAFRVLIIVLLSCACRAVANAPGLTLRAAAADKITVGVAVSSSDVNDPRISNLIESQFTSITAANALKPDHVEPQSGQFRFEEADRLVTFAHDHELAFVGHTLCWHEQTPRWMFQREDGTPLPREQALEHLRTHITTVVSHFKGRVRGWDVVNEVVSNEQSGSDLRDTPALRAIGPDYIEQAFRFAHEADPDAELYYNDFNIEQPAKRERAIRLIRRLKAAGVRIDAIGIQGHWGLRYPEAGKIEDAIRAFGAEGVKVMITELDIDVLPYRKRGTVLTGEDAIKADPYRDGCPPSVLDAEANRYRELFAMLMKHRDVITRITLWGVHDGESWLNDFPVRGRTNYPLLWDRNLSPKPAFSAVLDAIQNGK